LDHVVREDTTAGREVRRIREESLPKLKGGLRALYRTPELPGVNPLKAARAALDSSVLAAYGFSPKTDLLAARLLVLNREVAGGLNRAEPITAPASLPISPIRLGSSLTTASTLKWSHRSSNTSTHDIHVRRAERIVRQDDDPTTGAPYDVTSKTSWRIFC
jgi:hypothetical protein